MLIAQAPDRPLAVDRRLAWNLAAVAGALNTVAFQQLGFFSANMTGNVSLLSGYLAAADWQNSALFLLIVIVFIVGAIASTLLIAAGRKRGRRDVYAHCILLEGVLLGLLGCAELWLPLSHRALDLLIGLSFLMGLQNAVVTQISQARVRTTHISGMVTDIGIEIGLLLHMRTRAERAADYSEVRSVLALHVETVLAFLGGGVLGIVLFHALGTAIFLLAAAYLCGLALIGLLRLQMAAAKD